ncbi:MAG: 1-deoxy-D-xylulose-5-phosphate synthase, partial [Firmicutes bacterium]|nr:1-deoxy-D-xylulose-5-phosphate synthase [Bacillota bacterium]
MIKNITEYNFPEDLKQMSKEELELLPYAIREFLIDKVAQNGGHLASNLGVVELTLALHKHFDSPKDKIIWDVGHQAYVHKILTGRAKEFDTLRKLDGLSGFPKAKESAHDAYDTGHSSVSISAAAGLAAARDLKNENHEVIAVIGDGSLTGGMAFEALNNIGDSHSKVIVVLNDNGMSISPNTGSLSKYLRNIRTSKGYLGAKNFIKNKVGRLPSVGETVANGLAIFKNDLKYTLMGNG